VHRAQRRRGCCWRSTARPARSRGRSRSCASRSQRPSRRASRRRRAARRSTRALRAPAPRASSSSCACRAPGAAGCGSGPRTPRWRAWNGRRRRHAADDREDLVDPRPRAAQLVNPLLELPFGDLVAAAVAPLAQDQPADLRVKRGLGRLALAAPEREQQRPVAGNRCRRRLARAAALGHPALLKLRPPLERHVLEVREGPSAEQASSAAALSAVAPRTSDSTLL
jgi:hypothetical protein